MRYLSNCFSLIICRNDHMFLDILGSVKKIFFNEFQLFLISTFFSVVAIPCVAGTVSVGQLCLGGGNIAVNDTATYWN